MAARVVDRHLLKKISDERVQVYMVWLPILERDSREVAQSSANAVDDPRVSHFWIPDDAITHEFTSMVGLEKGARAWDIVLVYEEGTTWGETLPKHTSYMHQQLPLPKERQLDARRLADEVRALLESPPTKAAPSKKED